MTVCNTTEGQSCWISVMEQGITCKTQDACDHCKHMYCTLVLSFSPNKKNAYLDNWLKVNVKKYTVQRNQLSVNSYSASLACAFGVRYMWGFCCCHAAQMNLWQAHATQILSVLLQGTNASARWKECEIIISWCDKYGTPFIFLSLFIHNK